MAAMPSARAMLGSLRRTCSPNTVKVPESASKAPVMILMSVDFPAPFSPIKAWTSPARSSNDTSFKACTPANALRIDRASNTGAVMKSASRSLAQKSVLQSSINRNDVPSGFCALFAGQPSDGVRTILWENRPPSQRALCIEGGKFGSQLFRGFRFFKGDLVFLQRMHHAVARKHRGPSHYGRGRDCVDTHRRRQADRQLSNQVIEGRFAGVVRLRSFLRNQGISGTGKHHRGRQLLIAEDPLRLFGQQEIARQVDLERLGPLLLRQLAVGARNRIDGRRIHHDIYAAELRNAEV